MARQLQRSSEHPIKGHVRMLREYSPGNMFGQGAHHQVTQGYPPDVPSGAAWGPDNPYPDEPDESRRGRGIPHKISRGNGSGGYGR